LGNVAPVIFVAAVIGGVFVATRIKTLTARRPA
jgi:hypothetical protein